ncbi:MAG: helix-turn-helix domain-containing protein [Candidatus Ornithomonoglobus sp.]
MKERIKKLRKKKDLSQTEFGKILGVSRDVISNYEMGRVEPTDLFVNHLCTTFNVNEVWLRNGIGDMFVKSKQTILDELVVAHGLNNKETAIIKAFLDLSPEGRSGVLEYVDKLMEINSNHSQTDDLASGSIIKIDKPVQRVFPIAGRNGESGKVVLSEEEAEAAQEFIKKNYPELE